MPLEGSLSPQQLPPPQRAKKYQYCCQVGFWLGTVQRLQPAGGGRGWWRCPGHWRGARIRQWERTALQCVALGQAPRHAAHRPGSGAGRSAHPGQGWGKAALPTLPASLRAVPSPCHPPHDMTLGTRMSHHATPRTSHGTYLWSPGPRCSSGAGKALQADLAPNPRRPFRSLSSTWTLGGIRHSMSQRACKQEGQPVPGAPLPAGRNPRDSPSLAAPALHTRPLA